MYCWLSIENTREYSLTLALKSLAFSALMLHFLIGLPRVQMHRYPMMIAIIGHLVTRYWQIVIERIDDMMFSVRVRLRAPGLHMSDKVRYLLSALGSIMIELILLVRQLSMVIQSRGRLPHPRSWQTTIRIAFGRSIGEG